MDSISALSTQIVFVQGANISKFQLLIKLTETNCRLVFEDTIQHQIKGQILKLPIARLHSGGRHDETVGSSLVLVYL